jgi:hypothetical protein
VVIDMLGVKQTDLVHIKSPIGDGKMIDARSNGEQLAFHVYGAGRGGKEVNSRRDGWLETLWLTKPMEDCIGYPNQAVPRLRSRIATGISGIDTF